MTAPPARGRQAHRLAALDRAAPLRLAGRLTQASGLALEAAMAGVRLGDLVEVARPGRPLLAEVVGLREERAVLLPLGDPAGVGLDAEVGPRGAPLTVGVGEGLLGRVLDGLGRPIDGRPAPVGLEPWPVDRPPPAPLDRAPRDRAAAARRARARRAAHRGAGAAARPLRRRPASASRRCSAQLARGAAADLSVICLVGERGREVREFVEEALGPAGLARSVVVVATSDAPALVRLRAAHVATAIAEWFAERGARGALPARLGHPLRPGPARGRAGGRRAAGAAGLPGLGVPGPAAPAGADREPGARAGSPPSTRCWWPASDLDEPIADEVRGILDGHVVLDRRLAERGHFPAVDVLASVSRVMPQVIGARRTGPRPRGSAPCWPPWSGSRELVQLGAYQAGSDPETDQALAAARRRWRASCARARARSSRCEVTLARLAELAS